VRPPPPSRSGKPPSSVLALSRRNQVDLVGERVNHVDGIFFFLLTLLEFI